MLTFVINLHTGIPSMTLAEPFLYSLQKNDTIHLIFPSSNDASSRITEAALAVRKHLEASPYINYQVVFLVEISANGYSAFQESLAGKMQLIRKRFLENNWTNRRPSQLYMIAFDHVNNDEAIPDISSSTVYRDSWELDTKGFIKNENVFFVKEKEIKKLDVIWRTKVNVAGEVVNGGFKRLRAETQEKVNEATTTINKHVADFLNIDTIDFSKFSLDYEYNYIDETVIETIKNEFYHRLTNIKADPSRYKDFSPTETLKSVIGEQLSIFSTDNQQDFKLIRFPIQYNHDSGLQKYLLKLAFLLDLIVREEAVIKNLNRANYTIEVELDDKELGSLTHVYLEQLHNMEKRFVTKLNAPPALAINLLNSNGCLCDENLDKAQPSLWEVDFLRQNGDIPAWNDWNTGIKKQLENYTHQSTKKIQNCISKSHKKQTSAAKQEVPNIHHKVEELTRQRTTLQKEVEHNFIAQKFTYDWQTFREEKEKTLKPKLLSRPSSRELLLTKGVASILITLSFANTRLVGQETGISAVYYITAFFICIIVSYIAFWFARKRYKKEIDDLLQQVFDKARSVRASINAEFERQKEYLASLCNLNVVRKNYEEAVKEKEKHNEKSLLLDFHRQKLDEHKTIARNILQLAKYQESASNPFDFDKKLPDPDIHKPVYENAIYLPTTFLQPRTRENKEIAKIESTLYRVESPLTRIIKSVVFAKDRIYTQNSRW